jgi:hypothetical protein
MRKGVGMAKFMVLIYGDDAQWEAMTPEQWRTHGEAHGRFVAAAGERVIGGHQLTALPMATTVRAGSDGGVVLTDGAFLETKEGLGGYYLLEAADLDEVVKLVALLPEVKVAHSGVEIRPVVERA